MNVETVESCAQSGPGKGSRIILEWIEELVIAVVLLSLIHI